MIAERLTSATLALLTLAAFATGCVLVDDGSRFRFDPDAGSTDASPATDAGTDAGPDAGPLLDAGPPPEPCNGLDDDDDGLFDEDCAVVELTLGRYVGCAVGVSGELTCAGDGSFGGLGDGTRTVRGDLQPVLESGSTVATALGERHACRIDAAGDVLCWGLGDEGQLGVDVPSGPRAAPGAVAALSANVTLIAAGRAHTCARVPSGLECWGANDEGQIGSGDRDPTPSPAFVGLAEVTALAAGGDHTCAIADGVVHCWGYNFFGAVAGEPGIDPVLEPAPVPGPEAVSLALGENHTCALHDDGTARCWGDDRRYQRGSGVEVDEIVTLTLTGISALVAGDDHTCALVEGDVHCWGDNRAGQLGAGSSVGDRSRAVMVGGSLEPGRVTRLWAGGDSTCAQLDDLRVFCWGSDTHGQLMRGSPMTYATPRRAIFDGLTGVDEVSVGDELTCVRRASTVECVGTNERFELGRSVLSVNLRATGSFSGVASGESYVSVAVGDHHSCAVNDAQLIRCWGVAEAFPRGINTFGGHTAAPMTVARVGGESVGSASSGLELGARHSCIPVAQPDQSMHCWGDNELGQLGRGDLDRAPFAAHPSFGLAVPMPSLIAVGGRHTCASLTPDGDEGLSCWGANDRGQITGGVSGPVSAPMDLGELISGLTAGGAHTCVHTAADGLRCWGANDRGQLGTPASGPVALADAVPTGGADEIVALGEAHTCVGDGDVMLECWGEGEAAQTGRADRTTSHSPNQVVIGSPPQAIESLSLGRTHSCASTDAGELYCWGADLSGQLGIRRRLFFPTPSPISAPGASE